MDVTFMGAALPLTKTFVYRNSEYAVAPYPHVTRLTSYHEQVQTLDQFANALRKHAAAQRCLFNGQLQRPITQESRAQKTLKGGLRDWVVFDFDKIEAQGHADVVQRYLPSYCHNVAYIAQPSSSMFLPGTEHWSGHIFMLLKEAVDEKHLVQWFEHLNFTVSALTNALTLTRAGHTLHWPLDRSAAYDSKLIYIAPPRCQGFTPAIDSTRAIEIVRGKKPSLSIPDFTPIAKSQIDERINALRNDLGLDPLDLTTRRFGEHDVLIKTPPGVIHDVKAVGDHYIKLNLNGGDSYGYWIDLRNPSLIQNFKGEPALLTEKVDEKFYRLLAARAPQIVTKPPLEEGAEVLAFYARNQSSALKIGTFLPLSREIRLDTANETSCNAWLASWGVPRNGHLPLYDLVFDPQTDIQYVPGAPTINTFRMTDYMIQGRSKAAPSSIDDVPRAINKLIRSILGTPSDEEYSHFINWLAYIFQTRKKTGTAWVLHGTQGVGKGKFVEFVLRPLFSDQMVSVIQYANIDTDFNGFIDDKLFVIVNEASIRAAENKSGVAAKLREWITDSPIAITYKRENTIQKPNFANFIFCANERDPVEKPEGDRRLNVARRQDERLFFTPNEYWRLEKHEELKDFADVLHRWPVDEERVRTLIETDAARDVHEATTNIGALIAEALRNGDLGFFIERMPSDNEAAGDFYNRFNPLGLYRGIVDTALAGGKDVLTYDDLYILFRTLIPDNRFFQDSKTWRMRYFKSLGIDLSKQVWSAALKSKVQGMPVAWTIPDDAPKPKKKGDKVVSIKRGKS